MTESVDYKQAAAPFPSSEEDLLLHIQQHTFRYFWEFAHPHCGLARERNSTYYENVVTTGGSGFGLMAIVVAAEHGWIREKDLLARIHKVVDFLCTCQTFHGAFAHWYDGYTGQVIAFGKKDDGADLVETSFLMMGLLTVRQYLLLKSYKDTMLVDKINTLWYAVEWQWFTRGEPVLHWHWTPYHTKQLTLKIEGYNEALITYVLAASSPAHAVAAEVYQHGWARGGQMKNGRNFYNVQLPLGPDYGGPLFFAHYSFLGLDPRQLQDEYTCYWQQNVAHAHINFLHCIHNPKNYKGYGAHCWGLTACDSGKRYKSFSPTKDYGTICPSAAIASLPYLPQASMAAIKHFYFNMGKKIWGEYGFTDAFNKTRSWYASSYLAINQGPIIIMIENYRSGLLWNLFMSCPEIIAGLQKIGFKNVIGKRKNSMQ